MKKTFLFLLFPIFLHSNMCENKIFNITSKENSKIIDFIEQITDICELNLIIDRSLKDKFLNKRLNRVYIKKKHLNDVLKLFLSENNIFYTLSKDALRISYVKTETYHIDYIASKRAGMTTTEVSVGSDGGEGESSGGSSTVGTKIETELSFSFWENLKDEIGGILTRPEDGYKADEPIINEKAGLITVSGTLYQLRRVEKYLQELEGKLKKQVLIDVNILSVSLNKNHLTGINWSNFYNIISSASGTVPISDIPSNIITTASLEHILQFLRFNGTVKSISNPKIVALNNQPALISVGNEYFYSIEETQIAETDRGGSNTLNSTKIESVFAGILLDITAEISNNNMITLNINPSISQTIQTISSEFDRTIPPDLTKKQLSSVIITEHGKKVILGGLITKSESKEDSIVPLLGYIPIIGAFFRSQKTISVHEELIIIVTPYILNSSDTINFENKYKLIKDSLK